MEIVHLAIASLLRFDRQQKTRAAVEEARAAARHATMKVLVVAHIEQGHCGAPYQDVVKVHGAERTAIARSYAQKQNRRVGGAVQVASHASEYLRRYGGVVDSWEARRQWRGDVELEEVEAEAEVVLSVLACGLRKASRHYFHCRSSRIFLVKWKDGVHVVS